MQQMLASLKARRDREEGFTLIELMVVVLIIAILIAIAIPTFLGARERAQERAAQSSARNALTAAKTLFTDNENYENITAAALDGVEPALAYYLGGDVSSAAVVGTLGPNNVTFSTADTNADTVDDQITIATRANNSMCFALRENTASGATAGVSYAQWSTSGGAGCDSDAVPGAAVFSADGW